LCRWLGLVEQVLLSPFFLPEVFPFWNQHPSSTESLGLIIGRDPPHNIQHHRGLPFPYPWGAGPPLSFFFGLRGRLARATPPLPFFLGLVPFNFFRGLAGSLRPPPLCQVHCKGSFPFFSLFRLIFDPLPLGGFPFGFA